MWINAFQIDNKVISPIELLVLATVGEEKSTPKGISEDLIQTTDAWTPASGTLYPVLHRLEEVGLLKKTKGKNINFARTEKGSIYLSSILKPLLVQIQESNQYYLKIIESIFHLDPVPIGIQDFIINLELNADHLLKAISKLKVKAEKLSEDAYDVPITFE